MVNRTFLCVLAGLFASLFIAGCGAGGAYPPPLQGLNASNIEAGSLGMPTTPSNLVASGVSATAVTLSWTVNSTNESGFEIDSSTDGVNFTSVGTIGPKATSLSLSGLTPSTTYWLRAMAFNSFGSWGFTNVVTISTPSN